MKYYSSNDGNELNRRWHKELDYRAQLIRKGDYKPGSEIYNVVEAEIKDLNNQLRAQHASRKPHPF